MTNGHCRPLQHALDYSKQEQADQHPHDHGYLALKKKPARQSAPDNLEAPEERNGTAEHATPWKLALQPVGQAAKLSRHMSRISSPDPTAGSGAFYPELMHTMDKEQKP